VLNQYCNRRTLNPQLYKRYSLELQAELEGTIIEFSAIDDEHAVRIANDKLDEQERNSFYTNWRRKNANLFRMEEVPLKPQS
jgi:hypothetical protein